MKKKLIANIPPPSKPISKKWLLSMFLLVILTSCQFQKKDNSKLFFEPEAKDKEDEQELSVEENMSALAGFVLLFIIGATVVALQSDEENSSEELPLDTSEMSRVEQK